MFAAWPATVGAGDTAKGAAFATDWRAFFPDPRLQDLIAAAQSYLQAHQLADVAWRIDVVAVELSARGELQRVDLIENAVQG